MNYSYWIYITVTFISEVTDQVHLMFSKLPIQKALFSKQSSNHLYLRVIVIPFR